MTLSLRNVRDETRFAADPKKFSNRSYKRLVTSLLQCPSLDESLPKDLVNNYLNKYYDLQFYFLINARSNLAILYLQIARLCNSILHL